MRGSHSPGAAIEPQWNTLPAAVAAAPAALSCPVCGASRFAPMFGGGQSAVVHNRAAYRITQSSRFLVTAIQRCRGCGLGALPPGLADAAGYVEGRDDRFAEQADVRIRNAERLLRVLGAPASGDRLLDVGAAYGLLLVAARNLGYRASGVEVSRHAADCARRTYGVEVFAGRIEDAPLAPGGFDVITMADVIEHLDDPAAVITRLHRLLRPGGRLLILTPDLDSLVARMLGRHWWGLLDDHRFYFSRATLPRFLTQHGFATQHVGSFGRTFPLSHWIFKLSQYSKGVHRGFERMARALGVARLEIPLNLGDQMVCVARRVENG